MAHTPPAGHRFELDTPWVSNVRLEEMMLQGIESLLPGGICVDVGGSVGRVAERGFGRRPDLNWVTIDTHSAGWTGAGGTRFVAADGASLPFRPRSVGWLGFRSSLHYIGAAAGLAQAASVAADGAWLVVLAKVVDQFQHVEGWHRRLHEGRSLVNRELYTSQGLLDHVAAAGFNVAHARNFYLWQKYELDSWLTRGGDLPPSNVEKLQDVLDESPNILASDGHRPLVVRGNWVHNRLEWCLILAMR